LEATNHGRGGADFREELSAVRGDTPGRVGSLLERYRPYLLAIACQESQPGLAGKVGASDLVQDTILRGYEHFGSFEGTTREQLARWLRQILLNHARNAAKSFAAEKRDVAREQPLDSRINLDCGASPSGEVLAGERHELLQIALGRLPPELRLVIELRHREDLSFADIARRIAKSEDTARRLWARAIRQLQLAMQPAESRAN
jgi:RNA polymerase sigma-70 factor (ECF subfamily)